MFHVKHVNNYYLLIYKYKSIIQKYTHFKTINKINLYKLNYSKFIAKQYFFFTAYYYNKNLNFF